MIQNLFTILKKPMCFMYPMYIKKAILTSSQDETSARKLAVKDKENITNKDHFIWLANHLHRHLSVWDNKTHWLHAKTDLAIASNVDVKRRTYFNSLQLLAAGTNFCV